MTPLRVPNGYDDSRVLDGPEPPLHDGGLQIATLETNVSTDLDVKLAIYRHFAQTGQRPSVADVAARAQAAAADVLAAYERLRAQRVLVLEADGQNIRMAPPFSGIPTQHRIEAGGVRYFANCAWDALGVVAALQAPGVVHSRCEQSLEPLRLEIDQTLQSPTQGWIFHCEVPAAHWWRDIVFT